MTPRVTMPIRLMVSFSSRMALLAWIATAWTSPATAQSANDDCATPSIIASWPFATTANTTTATTAASDPVHSCSSANGSQKDNSSVWYSFTPPTAGTVLIDTSGTTYKSVVTVLTGACGALTELSCKFLPTPQPVTFTVQPGTTYLIEVTDWYGDGPGAGILHLVLYFLNWTFKTAPNEDHGLYGIRVAPGDDNLWYVGSNANGLYVTRNGGNAWEQHLTGLAWGLAIDPTDTFRVYAGSDSNLYRSDDQGLNWALIKAFPSDRKIYAVLVSPIDHAIFVGMHWGATQNENGMYRSMDGGQSWTLYPFHIPSLPYRQDTKLIVWDIAEDSINGYLYAGTEPSQKPACMPSCYQAPTLRSIDRGQTWQNVAGTPSTPGALDWHATRIQVDPESEDVYAQEEGGAVFVSQDFGGSWESLGPSGSWDLLIDPIHPRHFFAGAVSGAVQLSTDGAQSFMSVGPGGLSGPSLLHVALNTSSTRIYAAYAGSAHPGGVYVADLVGGRHIRHPPIAFPLYWWFIIISGWLLAVIVVVLAVRWLKRRPNFPQPTRTPS